MNEVAQTKESISKMNDTEILALYKTKSAAIRQMNKLNFTRSEIAKILNIRYQHVRNVLVEDVRLNKNK